MKEKIYNRARALRARLRSTTSALVKRLRQLAGDRALIRKLGGYAALAALLAILGAASCAYRERHAAVRAEQQPTPRAALAVQAAAPTPEPTPEPQRWVWPLQGEVIGAFAPDAPQWSATLEQWQTHPALDIAGSPGEAVYACGDGVVADAWRDRLWGNVIAIDHGDGWQSIYAGLNTLNMVKVGERVSAGDLISAVAPSVPCEADLPPHIHFSMTKDGEPVDFAEMAGDPITGRAR